MIVLASSTNDNQRGVVQSLLRGGEMSNRHLNTNNNNSGRSNTNNNSNGDTDDSGDGGDGSVKIRTTTSYRMFQLRATSMILNRVNTTISSAPSIEEDEGVGNDVYHDKDSSNNIQYNYVCRHVHHPMIQRIVIIERGILWKCTIQYLYASQVPMIYIAMLIRWKRRYSSNHSNNNSTRRR